MRTTMILPPLHLTTTRGRNNIECARSHNVHNAAKKYTHDVDTCTGSNIHIKKKKKKHKHILFPAYDTQTLVSVNSVVTNRSLTPILPKLHRIDRNKKIEAEHGFNHYSPTVEMDLKKLKITFDNCKKWF